MHLEPPSVTICSHCTGMPALCPHCTGMPNVCPHCTGMPTVCPHCTGMTMQKHASDMSLLHYSLQDGPFTKTSEGNNSLRTLACPVGSRPYFFFRGSCCFLIAHWLLYRRHSSRDVTNFTFTSNTRSQEDLLSYSCECPHALEERLKSCHQQHSSSALLRRPPEDQAVLT